MALGWITILQSVPWTDVIRNAPKVAETTRKLWNVIVKKNSQGYQWQAESKKPESVSAMEARISALEANTFDLNNQMLSAAENIKELADQNTQLIQRLEKNRILLILMSIAAGAVLITSVLSLWL